jgi:hypothetical protein
MEAGWAGEEEGESRRVLIDLDLQVGKGAGARAFE